MDNLEQQVEALRQKMIELAEKKQDLNDREVIAISQELDMLLIALQRKKLRKKHIFILR